MNTIQFALKTHHCFKTVAIFLQGMFSGIALWHIVATYVLIIAGTAVFMQYYFMLAFPVHCLYFFLFAISTVYALDRCVSYKQFFVVLIKYMMHILYGFWHQKAGTDGVESLPLVIRYDTVR